MAKSVRDAMTEDPRSIGASASVVEAARLMRQEHIGSLPVTEDDRLVGMITDRDITTRVVAESAVPETTSVGDVYSRDLISVEPNSDLDEALRLMARHQVRRLPVSRTIGSSAWSRRLTSRSRRARGPGSSSGRSPSPRRKSASSVHKSGPAPVRCCLTISAEHRWGSAVGVIRSERAESIGPQRGRSQGSSVQRKQPGRSSWSVPQPAVH
jgi:predicted transcriptional regulator